ncbi:HNH endonuclease family protein [Flammeovirga aprica]|uniref:TIGR02646 family protein n=1 Tax=Flammeovirga aprica JL-4 TaxID=694437 RepID=A0A7X9RRV5_9BACT|nr:hypothetical protein [Flammeovirga aprica]NME66555.1 hypothetical protein [Flammeovirga aprica JL-4]
MRSNNQRATLDIPERLTRPTTTSKWEQIAKKEIGKDKISGDVYKGKKRINGRDVLAGRNTLSEMYHHKCAYCESIEHAPEVEHYRPKKRVAEDSDHEGYYWLCYEWTNLLPSCRYCNVSPGKLDQFPVLGPRVYNAPIEENGVFNKDRCQLDAQELLDEKPVLLHPELDEVENYFTFQENGKIQGVDEEGRGEGTIDICFLNRANLLANRQQVIDEIVRDLEDYFLMVNPTVPQSGDMIKSLIKIRLKRLTLDCSIDKEFSLLKMICFRDFEWLIIAQFPEEAQREFLKLVYEDFLEENF